MNNKTKPIRVNKVEEDVISFIRDDKNEILRFQLKCLLGAEANNEKYDKVSELISGLDCFLPMDMNYYQYSGFMNEEVFQTLLEAVQLNKNIIIEGKAGVGKTVLMKALLDSDICSFPKKRFSIIDNYHEFDAKFKMYDNVNIFDNLTMSELAMLFKTPSRVIIGESGSIENIMSLFSVLGTNSSVLTSVQSISQIKSSLNNIGYYKKYKDVRFIYVKLDSSHNYDVINRNLVIEVVEKSLDELLAV